MMIGVGLDARLALPFDQLRVAAREAARLGFASLWTPAGGVPDSFHVCAAWSQDTPLRTGISVVPAARMWTPLGLAAQAATLAQLSIAWPMAQGSRAGAFIVPIPGAKSRKHLEENVRAADIVLTADDLAKIDRIVPPGAASGTRYPLGQMHRLNV